jgi:copper chaperone NosL
MKTKIMSPKQRYILALAVGLMALALWLPLWRIDIWAPQYPEGLSMQIAASHIDGNVDQINILNHYIGMKKIVPAQIPELSRIPWILATIVSLGVLVILSKKIFWVKIWLGLIGISAIVGLIDFYRWGYDYGHNLNPDAPIKIIGFSYQPPLFGFKKILNIEAYSLPDLGAYALGIGLVLALGVVLWPFWITKIAPRAEKAVIVMLPLLLFTIVSCTNKPEPIKIGIDHCDNCHMQISDVRFGGEVLTKKGRLYKFDSLQCLHEYLLKNADEVKTVFVEDYFNPGTLVDVTMAHFLTGSTIAGPMGASTVASKDRDAIEKLKIRASGKVTDWKGLALSSL